MPQVRYNDPDLIDSVSAVDAAIRERHHAAPVVPPAPKTLRVTKRQVWDPRTNILDQLAMGVPLSPPALQRLTGLNAVTVARTLLELQREGKVRESAPGTWEKVIVT